MEPPPKNKNLIYFIQYSLRNMTFYSLEIKEIKDFTETQIFDRYNIK